MQKTNDIPQPHLQTLLNAPLQPFESTILNQSEIIEAWFSKKWLQTPPPLTSSVDLRNAGFKLAPIDTNLFPAGYNNLNSDLMPVCVRAMQAVIQDYFPECTNILLLPENHTRNRFYLQSLSVLRNILINAGLNVRIGSLDPDLKEPQLVPVEDGEALLFEPLTRMDNKISLPDFGPCLLVLNNDLSTGIPDILQGLEQTILPSAELGWDNRLKSIHFDFYTKIASEFAALIDLDPWIVDTYFTFVDGVDFMATEGMDLLAEKADCLLESIRKKYNQYGIDKTPFVAVKADNGTYGMSVMMVKDGQELRELNRKQRTRMAAIKGSRKVDKVILQEGVYTLETNSEGAVAEPVIYMIGQHVAGGFYRMHPEKGFSDNLNAPGMLFEPLHFGRPEEAGRFYVYGVIARLAAMAAALEHAEVGE